MATICRKCALGNGMTTPPVRVVKAKCEICGGQNEDPNGKNYDVPARLMPNNPDHPDKVAEREENGG